MVGGIALALLAVSPPLASAAEQAPAIHYGQHQAVFLAGLLLGLGVRRLSAPSAAPGRDGWLLVAALLGLMLWNSPPVDGFGDSSVTNHFTVHGLMFATGAVFGWALAGLLSKGRPA